MKSEEIKKQLLEREQLLSDRLKKDHKVLNKELMTLILNRLNIDMKGNYLNYQNTVRLTRPDWKNKIINELYGKNWTVIGTRVAKFGELFEQNVLEKRQYYTISRIEENLHCVVITEKKEIDIENILNQKNSEEMQMLSWIVPYFHESDVITFSKSKRNIDIIFC